MKDLRRMSAGGMHPFAKIFVCGAGGTDLGGQLALTSRARIPMRHGTQDILWR